jgi:hypothetical protein
LGAGWLAVSYRQLKRQLPRYVDRSSETRGEPRIPNALAKGSWTPLVRRPAAVTIVVVVVPSPASSVVVVARAVVAMVVDALLTVYIRIKLQVDFENARLLEPPFYHNAPPIRAG